MSLSSTHVALFGVPRVLQGEREVHLPVRKTLALFVYLSIEGRSPRARLAELFWGGLDEATARRNLRRALHRLRAAGLGGALSADDDSVGLAGVDNDLEAFRRAVADGRLASALGLRSGGVFCDGLALEDADAFEEWLRGRREHIQREWKAVAAAHARALEIGGDLRAALATHGRLLDDDPLQEASYRELMRLHDALGERTIALELFARCERTLRDELQLEPLPETRLLADRIRAQLPPSALGAGRERPATTEATPPLTHGDLSAVPLVARDRELAQLAALRQAVVVIDGDAGVGKSRLALEAWRRAVAEAEREMAPPVLVRFTEMSASTPFHAVTDALRAPAIARQLSALELEARRDLARLLPELRVDPPGGGGAAPAPEEARTRLLEALAQALALAAAGPRVVLFDDLQWADASSIELLAHLARRHRQEPGRMARVIATARADELAINRVAASALQAIEKEGELARLPLGAFDEWSMLQLVQRLSNGAGGVRFAARLGAATGGNVFFALETIRALFETGELRVEPGRGWSTRYDSSTTDYAELPLPASVVDAVRARVARLGPAARRVLETAALAEDGSSLAEIQGATALSDWEALDGIERATAARVVDRAGGGYRFVHGLFRVAIRSAMSPERQRLLHGKLAAALEPLHAAPARIAMHWQEAGQSERAARAWMVAGDSASALHAHREAMDLFERAASLTADEELAFDLHGRAIESSFRARMTVEGRELIRRLLDKVGRTGSSKARFRALTHAADRASLDHDFAASEQHALRALREFEPPDGRYHVHALAAAAFAALQLDRKADALETYRSALEVARRHGIDKAVAMMAAAGSMTATELDRLDEAAALRDQALAAVRDDPGSPQRGRALAKGAYVSRALGDRVLALAHLAEACAISRKTRFSQALPLDLANLCEAFVDDGQAGPARLVQQELAALHPNPDAELRHLTAFTAAVVAEIHGELGDAIGSIRLAISAADELGSTPDRREGRLLQVRLLAALGAEARVEPPLAEAEALLAPGTGPLYLPAVWLRAQARVASDPEGARRDLLAALAAPFADRLLHTHLEAARIVLGRCELALGRADAARAAVRDIHYSVALECEAHGVRLAAAALDGRADASGLEQAMQLLDSDRLPPLHALRLMKVLATVRGKRGAASWRERMRVVAQLLADSLRGEAALQAGFIRKHRDLLT
ncbi:MAG: AAA family ATPase [Burkholderiales bacterium]|nr:AAA family ATPase [Burkholderiales bacterium]